MKKIKLTELAFRKKNFTEKDGEIVIFSKNY